jgi:hypothetical protein
MYSCCFIIVDDTSELPYMTSGCFLDNDSFIASKSVKEKKDERTIEFQTPETLLCLTFDKIQRKRYDSIYKFGGHGVPSPRFEGAAQRAPQDGDPT